MSIAEQVAVVTIPVVMVVVKRTLFLILYHLKFFKNLCWINKKKMF